MKIYNTLHRVLAEGSFALSIGEGFLNAVHSSFYDLFRISEGKIVEHWDTIDAIPPRSEWKNNNGKFWNLNEGLRASRGMIPEYDGVAEVWFDSEEDLMEAMNSPEGQKLGAALLEDESNFIDHSRSSAFIVKEQEL